MENENKFVTLTVKKANTREFKFKQNENGYSITIDQKLDGTALPKDGTEFTFLLSEKRLSKIQPKNSNYISFWLFKDEKVKIQKSFRDEEQGKWIREFVATVSGVDTLKLCKNIA